MKQLLSKIVGSELINNRYFAISVAIQKGIPILIIPLVVSLYGSTVYADYVLLYSVVQIVAIITGLCLTQAVIPFWFSYHDKENYLGSLLMLMLATQVLLSSAAFAVLSQINIMKEHLVSSSAISAIAIGYAVIYNLNAFGLNFLRAQFKQMGFFWTTILGAALQIVLIVLFSRLPGNGFLLFVLANVLAVLFQTITYFLISDHRPTSMFAGRKYIAFSWKMLKFSVPLSVYVVIALLSLVIDKWIVKAYFQQQVFAQYVIDYQFSFSIALTSIVIGMYNTSRQCELVYKEDWEGVRSNTVEHYRLSLIGSLALCVATYFYARVGGLHLSDGFWILVLSFTMNNLYAVNSSLLAAQKRSHTLARLAGVGTAVFIMLLFTAAYMDRIMVVYSAHMIFQIILFILSWVSIRSLMNGNVARLP